jgi:XTP/dITP diphosphohydrolase
LLLATNNPGKVREFRRLLEELPFEVVAPADAGIALEVEEDGRDYTENAIKKAEAFAAAGDCIALADDSGIEVDALDGRPAHLSARYGGPGLDDEGRMLKLLDDTSSVPDGDRGARYRAIVAVAVPGVATRTFEGVLEGSLAREPAGSGGFGYDPIFVLAGGRTTAELSADEKDAASHRGRALRAAIPYLRELAGC